MFRKRIAIIFIIIWFFISLNATTAQYETLVPNSTTTGVSISGTEVDLYNISLAAGDWTVTVSSSGVFNLEFRVGIYLQSDTSTVIGEAEGAGSSGVSVNFNLESDEVVIVRVELTSYGMGFYDIGVYDSLNVFLQSYGSFLLIGIVLIIVILMIIICKKKSRDIIEGISVEAPEHVIPEKYRREPTTADIRTVRLPEKCPKCGAALSQEDIDWTGPLEAKCLYCGAVIRAKFERII